MKKVFYLMMALLFVGVVCATNDDLYRIKIGEKVYQELSGFESIETPKQSVYVYSNLTMLGSSLETDNFATYPLRDLWSLDWITKNRCFSITTKLYGNKKVYLLTDEGRCSEKNSDDKLSEVYAVSYEELPYLRTFGNPKHENKPFIKLTNPLSGSIVSGITIIMYTGIGFHYVDFLYSYEGSPFMNFDHRVIGDFPTINSAIAPNGNYQLQLQTDNGLTSTSGTFSIEN